MSSLQSLITTSAAAVRGSRRLDQLTRFNPLVRRRVSRVLDDPNRDQRAAELLARSLRWAASTDYGKDCGAPSELAAWPILEKEQVRERPDRFVNRRVPSLGASTGGTTGTPLILKRSLPSLSAEQVFLDSMLELHGTSFAAGRFAVLRGEDVKDPSDDRPPYGVVADGGHRLSLSSQHLGPSTVHWFADALNEFAPEFLWAYPSTASLLARLAIDAGLSIPIPLIVSSSEMLQDAERALLDEAFAAPIIDYYGQAERVALSASHEPGRCLFNPLYGHVELLPLDSDDDDFEAAEIVATGFWNQAMPLVRYRTGDEILYRPNGDSNQLAQIAAGNLPFHSLRGRSNDFLRSPDGGILVGIDHLARSLADVDRMQVVQESLGSVSIRLLTGPSGLTPTDRATLEATIAKKLPDTVTVTIEVVDELERTEAGKTPFVIRRVN